MGLRLAPSKHLVRGLWLLYPYPPYKASPIPCVIITFFPVQHPAGTLCLLVTVVTEGPETRDPLKATGHPVAEPGFRAWSPTFQGLPFSLTGLAASGGPTGRGISIGPGDTPADRGSAPCWAHNGKCFSPQSPRRGCSLGPQLSARGLLSQLPLCAPDHRPAVGGSAPRGPQHPPPSCLSRSRR